MQALVSAILFVIFFWIVTTFEPPFTQHKQYEETYTTWIYCDGRIVGTVELTQDQMYEGYEPDCKESE
jgi:hypothetical protein